MFDNAINFHVSYTWLQDDQGIVRDGISDTGDIENELSKRSLAQDLNRHGTVVLEGRTLGGNIFFFAI